LDVKFSIIVFLIILSFRGYGQETKLSEVIISIAEELTADDSDPEAVSAFMERLYEIYENKVILNTASADEISRLFFLSDFQVKALADYVKSAGKIVSGYELMNIPGFDRETTEMMIPFISLETDKNSQSESFRLRNTLITNLSFKSGADTANVLGSQWKILTKYKFNAGRISGGFTAEKDPGERFFNGNTMQPDFTSANFAFTGTGLLRKLIIGDYSARFGQGTNINTGIRTGLSLTSNGYMSASDGIRPYTSTDENNFFRGVAADFSIKKIQMMMFFSKNYSDAAIDSGSGDANDHIVTFYKTGTHNTTSLLLKKDTYYEVVYGISGSYDFEALRIGISWSQNRFSLPVKPDSHDPVKIFDFEGNRNDIYSIYYNTLINKMLLYGELSANNNKNIAFVNGLSFRPSDRLTINTLYRNYNPGYSGFHGRGPGIRSVTGNERGILSNFIFEAAKHLFISAGSDIHYFPWLKYRCSSPSWGRKHEVRIKYLPSEKLVTEISYHNRMVIYDEPGNSGIPGQQEIITDNFKSSLKYKFSENLTFGTRIDYKLVTTPESKGILMSQDIIYKWNRIPVTLWFRYCLFHTDDWNSRLYLYENDLLYSFSIPALSGKGSRSYLMVKYEASDMLEVRVKYGITSTIENNLTEHKEEIRFQVKMFF
jgi:hypothetical protein